MNVERDNWEPRLSKFGKCVSSWKNRSLCLIGKVLILNILGFSKLLFVSSILATPRWVCDKVNRIIWPFLWGSRIETVARKSLVCPETDGGLGLRDFYVHGQASRLSILIRTLSNAQLKSFFLLKYFCGAQLASIQNRWTFLRDNTTPSALSPSPFYSPLIQSLRDLRFPADFSFSAKDFYKVLLAKVSSAPILPRFWSPFVPRSFSLVRHWSIFAIISLKITKTTSLG